MKKIVVFDLDGTLAKTEVYWLPVLAEFTREMERRYGLPHSLPELRAALQLLGTSDRELLGVMYPGRSEEEYAEFHRLSNTIWKGMENEYRFELFEGAGETLAGLKESGWTLLLSSNCDLWYLGKFMEGCGLNRWISGAACAEMYPGKKKWEFTADLLRGLTFDKGYFAGDSSIDMRSGRENGLTTIHCAYGYARCDDPTLIDIRIQSVREIADALK